MTMTAQSCLFRCFFCSFALCRYINTVVVINLLAAFESSLCASHYFSPGSGSFSKGWVAQVPINFKLGLAKFKYLVSSIIFFFVYFEHPLDKLG